MPVDDMRYAMQSNLAMSSVSSALRNLALEVIRISNDLRLLSSGPNTGLAEINLPALQPGSSIMPGKINPVMAELAAMVSFQVIGYDTAVAFAVQAGQLELNVMMPTMAHSVLTSITIMTNMLRQLTDFCVKGITANEARCQTYAQSTVSLATALNPYIGYAKAAEIAKESVATGKTIIDIARSKGYLSDAQIKEILDPGAHDRAAAPVGRRKESRKDSKEARSFGPAQYAHFSSVAPRGEPCTYRSQQHRVALLQLAGFQRGLHRQRNRSRRGVADSDRC